MDCILYMVQKRIKNYLVEFVHTPAKLILFVISLVIIVAINVFTLSSRNLNDNLADIRYFKFTLFAYITLFVGISTFNGLNLGDSIFDMSDVNLLFTAPVAPRNALVYGIAINMSKSMLKTSILLMSQAHILASFGIGIGGSLLILFFCLLAMILCFILSHVTYVICAGSKKRALATKIVITASFVPLIVQAIVLSREGLIAMDVLKRLSDSLFMDAVPVSGWIAASCIAFLKGDNLVGACFLGLIGLAISCFMLYFIFSNADFYEDVLCATETAFEKRRNALEGTIGKTLESKKRIKVKKTGLAGAGAATFFHKHLREASRRNVLGLLSNVSLLMVGAAALYTLLLRHGSSEEPSVIAIIIFALVLWIQTLGILYGEGMKELLVPYIYLTPEPSINKILWSNLCTFLRLLIEGALIFAVVGAILHVSVLMICILALGYALFSLKVIALNYLSIRFIGINIAGSIFVLPYTVVAMLTSAPGAILGAIVGDTIGGVWTMCVWLLIFCVWEAIFAVVCFALSADLLNKSDIVPVKK